MDRKELYNIWAPQEGGVWTRYAKPALFVHAEGCAERWVFAADIPLEIRQFANIGTAFIVDLPDVKGIEVGLGLLNNGLRPVPLYNGIHERNNGGLNNAVDNIPIIAALVAGSKVMNFKNKTLNANSPPAFLLDSNRDKIRCANDGNIYDNRWNVDSDDLPSVDYMTEQGIKRIVVWSNEIKADILPILNKYQSKGIDLITYINGEVKHEKGSFSPINPDTTAPLTAVQEAVRIFENARFAMLILMIMAFVNFIFMWSAREAPLLWTTPCIMWLTYLWVPEIIGDLIAIFMLILYALLYWSSQKHRNLLYAAFALHGFDLFVYLIYVFTYSADYGSGLFGFTGYSLTYAALYYILPVAALVLLTRGVIAYSEKLSHLCDDEYYSALDVIDGISVGDTMPHVPRERHFSCPFRPYRSANFHRYSGGGYSGYGGTGRGGYGRGGGGFGG
jgi:uncharacterized membrane protein YgcG